MNQPTQQQENVISKETLKIDIQRNMKQFINVFYIGRLDKQS